MIKVMWLLKRADGLSLGGKQEVSLGSKDSRLALAGSYVNRLLTIVTPGSSLPE